MNFERSKGWRGWRIVDRGTRHAKPYCTPFSRPRHLNEGKWNAIERKKHHSGPFLSSLRDDRGSRERRTLRKDNRLKNSPNFLRGNHADHPRGRGRTWRKNISGFQARRTTSFLEDFARVANPWHTLEDSIEDFIADSVGQPSADAWFDAAWTHASSSSINYHLKNWHRTKRHAFMCVCVCVYARALATVRRVDTYPAHIESE